jgi:hypothetical protein
VSRSPTSNRKALDLRAAQAVAEAVGTELGFLLQTRVETQQLATSLVIEGPQPETARIILTTIEPGTLFLDIGTGIHGEWVLRSDKDVSEVTDVLRQIFAAVFRGNIVEEIQERPFGRLRISGSITTPSKTYKFKHYSADIPHTFTGTHRYAPYPTVE